MSNRIQQLQQTILELRIRGLEARSVQRQYLRTMQEQKTALEAAQDEIQRLKGIINGSSIADGLDNTHQQFVSLASDPAACRKNVEDAAWANYEKRTN